MRAKAVDRKHRQREQQAIAKVRDAKDIRKLFQHIRSALPALMTLTAFPYYAACPAAAKWGR
jgi:hypothetical protein